MPSEMKQELRITYIFLHKPQGKRPLDCIVISLPSDWISNVLTNPELNIRQISVTLV